jgi:hypothetical protein
VIRDFRLDGTLEISHQPARRNAVNLLSTSAPLAPDDAPPPEHGHTIGRLVDAYVVLAALALVVAELLHGHRAPATRTHAIIVLVSGLLTRRFTAQALQGSRRALLRLRIVTIVVPVAIAVVIAIPGDFPIWMKLEQAVGFVLLAAVAALLNRRVATSTV